jgi:hypothetical protein
MGHHLYKKSTVALMLLLCGCYNEGRKHARALEAPGYTGPVEGGEEGNAFQAPVPEPMTLALLGGGLVALAASRRKRKHE